MGEQVATVLETVMKAVAPADFLVLDIGYGIG
jgi:hypothetical protein